MQFWQSTWSNISSKAGLLSGCSLQHCFISWMHSRGAWSGATVGLHMGGGFFTFLMISADSTRYKLRALMGAKICKMLPTDQNTKQNLKTQKTKQDNTNAKYVNTTLSQCETKSFNTTKFSHSGSVWKCFPCIVMCSFN